MIARIKRAILYLTPMGMSKEEIGRKLKEAREKKRLTQAEVAKEAGLGTNYYAVIERGEVKTSPEKLEKICKALGIRLVLG